MSNFTDILNNFLGTYSNNEIEISILNELMKYGDEFNSNPQAANNFMNSFRENNKNLFALVSQDFLNDYDSVLAACNEGDSLMETQYDGYWEDTSMIIKDKYERPIKPEIVVRIRNMAEEYYKIRIDVKEARRGKPMDELIVKKIPISKMVGFEKDVKEISPDLIMKNVSIDGRDFNIANKVNKMNKKITAEDLNLNESEKKEIKENTTADINVPELSVSAIRKRVQNYNPWKGANNIMEGSKPVIQQEAEVIMREGKVKKVNLDEGYFIIDFEGQLFKESIDKEDFASYLTANSNVSKYITESQFSVKSYLNNKGIGTVDFLIKEYFENKNEQSTVADKLNIEEVFVKGENVIIRYYLEDSEEGDEISVPIERFETFLSSVDSHNYEQYFYNDKTGNEDYPNGFGKLHDFDLYWQNLEHSEKAEFAKAYLLKRLKK